MRIDNEMVLKKEISGTRKDGSPVVMIVTYGGLYAFFSKNNNGDVETLGMAPHKAIAAWMAEQKAKDIKWNEGFLKSEKTDTETLSKSEDNIYIKLRNLLFNDTLVKSEIKSDYYIIYDLNDISIGVMKKNEIQEMLDSGEAHNNYLVRNLNLTEPYEFITEHKEFFVG